jgi:hypothetical protein
MTDNKKYLNFPVPLVKELYIDSFEFYNKVFNTGVYIYSKSLTGNEAERYKDALKFLGISQPSYKSNLSEAKCTLLEMPPRYPISGIAMDMLWDYYTHEKTDFDIACLGAFLGIKSILGTKPYCKTNKAFIHARMFGYSSSKEMPYKLSPIEAKYQIRWHMDKVLMELQNNWFLKLVSNHQRGMYLSFDISLAELYLKAENNKQLTKIKQLKDLKNIAFENAKTKLTTH